MALNLKRIKAQMQLLDIGNKELSIKSGIPLRTVNNILSGLTTNPTIDSLKAIAKTLNCIVDDFVDDEKTEPQTIAAHHDSEQWTEEELDEIEKFKEYVKSKRK